MSQQQKVDLTQLPAEQIMEIQKNLNQEVNHFSTSLQALTSAQSKFDQCIQNIKQVTKSESADTAAPSNQILVPLSSSLYVPGKIKSGDKFLVDVGTGYYVEKSGKGAIDFYQKKITKLDQDLTQLKEIIQSKSETLQTVTNVLRSKLAQQQGQAQE
ncbi:hypothetical protein BABINDRAFT_33857 [Babjeviella inositovora NRRL Y-12698]|uniref:Prefoldin alpha subunit n=1 Tax=Babjeviella inositovora NRRL Y-12698 TaxID=984486 RepID=A0A1E3QTD1_9ASCO|nr:uncharacterized protein BABINDRAFT_33857 [Babjeviella inositovora NRRL Y-12698]ODQ80963.1 hypothetical protein BABINDRAFT_33857 [Babjeviella inositovora NRRL Y-12698]